MVHIEHLLQLLGVGHDQRADLGMLEDERDIGLGGGRRHHDVDDSGAQTRQIHQGHLEAVIGQDRQRAIAGVGNDREKASGNEVDPPGGLSPADLPARSIGRYAEERPLTVVRCALLKEAAKGEVGALDKSQDPSRPVLPRAGLCNSAQQSAPAQHVQQLPRDLLRRAITRDEAFGASIRQTLEGVEREKVEQRIAGTAIGEEIYDLGIVGDLMVRALRPRLDQTGEAFGGLLGIELPEIVEGLCVDCPLIGIHGPGSYQQTSDPAVTIVNDSPLEPVV